MTDPRYPARYQINSRVWLTELSRKLDRSATLDDIPEAELDRIAGSGFAITGYTAHQNLGGDAALNRLRERLRKRGLRLLLDFVPNHMALDHPWVEDHPNYFVAGTELDLARAPHNYLYSSSVVLIRLSTPANSEDGGMWLEDRAGAASLALSLLPFAGIAFLWFVGVVRALGLLPSIGSSLWVTLIFPAWVCAVSVYILISNLRSPSRAAWRMPMKRLRSSASIIRFGCLDKRRRK